MQTLNSLAKLNLTAAILTASINFYRRRRQSTVYFLTLRQISFHFFLKRKARSRSDRTHRRLNHTSLQTKYIFPQTLNLFHSIRRIQSLQTRNRKNNFCFFLSTAMRVPCRFRSSTSSMEISPCVQRLKLIFLKRTSRCCSFLTA